jgi:hypothetical protein
MPLAGVDQGVRAKDRGQYRNGLVLFRCTFAWNHLDQAGVERSWLEMVSTGPGLTWQLTPNAALRPSWGFPLIRNGHTGPSLGPQFGTQISF